MHSGDAQRLLLDAARLLSTSLDVKGTLRRIAGLAVPRLGDACEVHLLRGPEDQDRPSPLARSEALGLELPECAALVADVCEAGRPVLFPRSRSGSYAFVPLIARGAPLGALILRRDGSGPGYDRADHALVELLELFGARAALALDSACLHSAARRAHDAELRASRLEAQLIQTRLEALRAQLNPHFLFNALNTVAMLVRRQANAEALRGIVGLSQLLRQVLARRASQEVSLGEELALVEHYLAVEQLRYPDRLRTRIRVNRNVLDAQVPNLLLQPLVENAVRHGVARRRDAGLVEIAGFRRGRTLTLEVRDDGPGLPDDWSPDERLGVGLGNTRERLQRLYGARHRFELRNCSRGGARAIVRIPFHTAPAA
jgi:GAF domain-containing protein